MELKQIDWKDRFPALGLGSFMLIAGISKLFIIEYWTGYEPQILIRLMPLNTEQLVLLGGLFEAVLGALLIAGRKTKEVSVMVAIYLGLIALQLINLGIWDLAIRDLGLVFYALTVYLLEK